MGNKFVLTPNSIIESGSFKPVTRDFVSAICANDTVWGASGPELANSSGPSSPREAQSLSTELGQERSQPHQGA
jgi:hypothetical protein